MLYTLKTIGLRLSDKTYNVVLNKIHNSIGNVPKQYQSDLFNGSSMIRITLCNFIVNPPTNKQILDMIIANRDDDSFYMYLNEINKK